ncbi:hypothetical protein LCM10_05100 [Rossellomorea aquimaris]|uniref:hypothetical protein n=1 Tax=Rossellomorea aquimaris TaxID=189382 RepID=UPI001CD72216|nr:hypothetical protein [Rossellomorea aquimaris]MCA1054355.1 hypothetical protein [Rossellomorea aquimaris]
MAAFSCWFVFHVFVNVLLGYTDEPYVFAIAKGILILSLIASIPSFVFFFRNRFEGGSVLGLVGMLVVLPVPFVVVAVVMGIFYGVA